MNNKIALFLIVFLSLFVLVDFALAKKCKTDKDCGDPKVVRCIDEKCVKALEIPYPELEITYPEIGGEKLTIRRVVKEGLPGYVKYIFTLAVGIIGFIIFGVLVYNGIRYLTSVGRPEQMAEAKTGILYAFLGGLLLLSSVLIFRTINPQLTIMELPKVELLEPVVIPGVYICNYEVNKDEIKKALEKYITPKKDQDAIEGAKKLKEIIWNPKTKQGCPLVKFSGNLNFQVTKTETIFIVPSISIDPKTKKRQPPKYEFGIVLHEKENFGGQCDYYPKEDDNSLIYHQIENLSPKKLKFTARSVTLFQEPSIEPVGDGVILYRYFNYNRDEPEATTTDQNKFKPEGDANLKKVKAADLGNLKEDTRSISFSPQGSYLALLYEGPNFDKRCQILQSNQPNLLDISKIGICPLGCKVPFVGGWLVRLVKGKPCAPCLNSMIVIKGSVL